MPKYIDKDKMIQDIKDNYVVYGYEDFLNDFFKMVDEQPTVDVVKHGHWMYQDTWAIFECSNCGHSAIRKYPYCMWCGERMDEAEE